MKQSLLHLLRISLALALFALIAVSCKKDDDPQPPPNPVDTSRNSVRTGLVLLDRKAYESLPLIEEPSISLRTTDEYVLPERITLPRLPPVGDQMNMESCAGWASAYGARTIHFNRLTKPLYTDPAGALNTDIVFSPEFVWTAVNGGVNRGVTMQSVLHYMQQTGIAKWKDFPVRYAPAPGPTAAQKQLAATYKIKAWGRVRINNSAIKKFLNVGTPVVAAINTDEHLLQPTEVLPDGSVMWRRGGKAVSAHAVVIVGYDDRQGGFLVQNSWGRNWGGALSQDQAKASKSGYFWIRYEDLETVVTEAYVISEQIENLSPTLFLFGKAGIAALDPRTGKRRWFQGDFQTDPLRTPLPTVSGNYILAPAGHLYAFNASTGKKIWQGYGDLFSVSADETKVYSSRFMYKQLYAIDLKTGVPDWVVDLPDGSRETVVHDGKVIFQSGGKLLCLDTTSGKKLWEIKLQSANLMQIPAVQGSDVFVTSDWRLHSVNITTGTVNWSVKTDINGLVMGILDGALYLMDYGGGGGLNVYDTLTGRLKWHNGHVDEKTKKELVRIHRVFSGENGSSGTIYTLGNIMDTFNGDNEFYLIGLDANTGAFKWKRPVDDIDLDLYMDGIIYKNVLYLSAEDGSAAFSINPSSTVSPVGNLLWKSADSGFPAYTDGNGKTIQLFESPMP